MIEGVEKRGDKVEDKLKWFGENIGKKCKGQCYTEVNALITNGTKDMLLISPSEVKSVTPLNSKHVVKTTGAGDTLTGTICSLLLRGKSIEEAVRWGMVASKMTVESINRTSTIS